MQIKEDCENYCTTTAMPACAVMTELLYAGHFAIQW